MRESSKTSGQQTLSLADFISKLIEIMKYVFFIRNCVFSITGSDQICQNTHLFDLWPKLMIFPRRPCARGTCVVNITYCVKLLIYKNDHTINTVLIQFSKMDLNNFKVTFSIIGLYFLY